MLLKNLKLRVYQQVMFSESISKNTLVVLPTGLGKTIIMITLTAYFLTQESKKGLVVLTTPTKPLVHQIANSAKKFLDIPSGRIMEVTGQINALKRKRIYRNSSIVVGTPQTLRNDLQNRILDPSQVTLLCIDEAHRALGNHAYCKIASFLDCHIVGFTATPGNNIEQVFQVCENLKILNVTSRGEDDPDIEEFVSVHRPKTIFVPLPKEYITTLSILQGYRDSLIDSLRRQGHLADCEKVYRKNILELHNDLLRESQSRKSFGMRTGGGKELVYTANLMRAFHLIGMIETQGFEPTLRTIQEWRRKPQRALQAFFEDPRIHDLLEFLEKAPLPHPKIQHLLRSLKKLNPESKCIVFTNYRKTVTFLKKELTKDGILCKAFVGQGSSGGRGSRQERMTQKEQHQVLEEFRDGSLQVIIATSVAEEGIDVSQCDLVVFYDSVASTTRWIQRTGRGRKKESKVIHLVTKGTKDERDYWYTRKKGTGLQEFLSKRINSHLSKRIESPIKKLSKDSIDDQFKEKEDSSSQKEIFTSVEGVTSELSKCLMELGCQVNFKQDLPKDVFLTPGNTGFYIMRDDTFERLLIQEEFYGYQQKLDSVFDDYIVLYLQQSSVPRLVNFQRKVQSLLEVITRLGIPIIPIRSLKEGAQIISHYSTPEGVSKVSSEDVRLNVLASMPGINKIRGKALLSHFGSLEDILSASKEELQEVSGVGSKVALKILNVIRTPISKNLDSIESPEPVKVMES